MKRCVFMDKLQQTSSLYLSSLESYCVPNVGPSFLWPCTCA